MKRRYKIGMVGMGKLGTPCLLAMESKGHDVYGYEIHYPTFKSIMEKKINYTEEGAQELLTKSNLTMSSLDEIVRLCDIIFVAVQTPHDEKYGGAVRIPDDKKDFDYSYLKDAVIQISNMARKKKKTCIVSVISTVLPGTMDREIKPLLNEYIKLCYNPFFIAMGTAIQDFLFPEFILLGVDDKEAHKIVKDFYATITDADVRSMSVASAECTKVFYNTFITSKICFTNSVGRICHESKGANCDDVMNALQHATKRIVSPSYMNVGMGDGGNCHPRDNIALDYICEQHEWDYNPWKDMMLWREGYASWMAELIYKEISKDIFLPVYFIGYAFKKDTNLIGGSPALLVKEILMEMTASSTIIMYDPIIDKDEVVIFREGIYFIGCNHTEAEFFQFPKGSIVIDPFRVVKEDSAITLIQIGNGGKHGK